MIEFHNDHLVSPDLCKLLYDTIPEDLHVPVVFVPHTKKYSTSGTCYWDHIKLFLQGVFYGGFNRGSGSVDFGIWQYMLKVAYHEFGHLATYEDMLPVSQNAYESDFGERRRIEHAADKWAEIKLLELAEHEKRLCQPQGLGPYFDGRIVKLKRSRHHKFLKNYRCYKTGGQLSTGDVAKYCETWKPKGWWKPDTRLIRRLAKDLAFEYIDRAGRLHMFFAWGDLPEIKRRVAAAKA